MAWRGGGKAANRGEGRNRATRRVVLAAGGTGGHVYPAHAVMLELIERGYSPAIVTDRRGADALERADAEPSSGACFVIPSGTTTGQDTWSATKGIALAAAGFVRAFSLLTRLTPDVVVGFGSYGAAPTVVAALLRRVPTLIHEGGAILGKANRLALPFVDAVALSNEETISPKPFNPRKTVVTGHPVRPQFVSADRVSYRSPSAGGEFRVLVVGGSQGAAVLGGVTVEAIALLPDDLRARLHVTHQCRTDDLETLRRKYADISVRHETAVFFRDVHLRLIEAHLVICRAGAASVAELATVGRPAILVPQAAASDDHQMANARLLERMGLAWVLQESEFTAERLAELIRRFEMRPRLLAEAARKGGVTRHAVAASRITDLVEELSHRR